MLCYNAGKYPLDHFTLKFEFGFESRLKWWLGFGMENIWGQGNEVS